MYVDADLRRVLENGEHPTPTPNSTPTPTPTPTPNPNPSRFKVAHGLSNALMLPHVLAFNAGEEEADRCSP